MLCVLQGTAASGRVVPPWDFKSWVGHYPAGGDVTTVPDHRYRIRPQPEAGGSSGGGGAQARAEVGNGQRPESKESRGSKREASERALLSVQRSLKVRKGAETCRGNIWHEKRGGDKCAAIQPSQFIFNIGPSQFGYHRESPAQVLTHSAVMNQS